MIFLALEAMVVIGLNIWGAYMLYQPAPKPVWHPNKSAGEAFFPSRRNLNRRTV